MHTHHAFGYERYNQDLKAAKTNNKGSFEVTIANKFLQSIHKEDFFVESITDLGSGGVPIAGLKAAFLGIDIHGNDESYEDMYLSEELEASKSDDYDLLNYVQYAGCIDNGSYTHAYGFESLPINTVRSLKFNTKKAYSFLNEEEYLQLVCYYQFYFNEPQYIFGFNDTIDANASQIVKVDKRVAKFKSINILGQRFSSIENTSLKGGYFKAYYRDSNLPSEDHVLRPAQIQCFFRHSMELLNVDNELETASFTLAYVRWYKDLDPGSNVTTFNNINSTCYSNNFMDASFMDILPVQCIHSPIGIYVNVLENINVVIDIPRKIEE